MKRASTSSAWSSAITGSRSSWHASLVGEPQPPPDLLYSHLQQRWTVLPFKCACWLLFLWSDPWCDQIAPAAAGAATGTAENPACPGVVLAPCHSVKHWEAPIQPPVLQQWCYRFLVSTPTLPLRCYPFERVPFRTTHSLTRPVRAHSGLPAQAPVQETAALQSGRRCCPVLVPAGQAGAMGQGQWRRMRRCSRPASPALRAWRCIPVTKPCSGP